MVFEQVSEFLKETTRSQAFSIPFSHASELIKKKHKLSHQY
jgi:hypothetical protein